MSAHNKRIRIGIDIRDLRVAKTGQKTVTEELVKQFISMDDPDLEFVLLDSKKPIYTGKNKWRIRFEHIRYQYWKQIVLPLKARHKKCDILFCGDYFAPYIHLGYKTVEIFYDAFFFEFPEHYNKPFLKLFHNIAMPAARRCERIMTITEYSKKKLHELAGFPMDKLITVYPSYKTTQQPADPSSETLLPVARGRKYILHVGVMEKRKNLPRLIDAFAALVKKGYDDLDLVLVGQGNGKIFSDDSADVQQAINKHGIESRVICTGYLPDEQVGQMYNNAFLYVFPSINEGFGIPILEAFRFGVPVIVANNSCLPEVGGDAVLTFNPYDPADICRAMQQVIDNEQLRRELIGNGKKRLPLFTWEKAANSLAEVFKEIATLQKQR